MMAVQSNFQKGFTVLELVAVVVIVGILAVSAGQRLLPSSTAQLQASRDTVVSAFSSAQQRAMSQQDPIRVIASATSIDIRQDTNRDGNFASSESQRIGGVLYPVSFSANQTLTVATFDFDRLGRTSAQALNLSQSGNSVVIQVTSAGYSY